MRLSGLKSGITGWFKILTKELVDEVPRYHYLIGNKNQANCLIGPGVQKLKNFQESLCTPVPKTKFRTSLVLTLKK